ncbi:hypothetical protein PSN45_004852 [Yamadazyma tenuis]|nr:hypothetical protein PSN45_004852 [Yamadazyma tenuis]
MAIIDETLATLLVEMNLRRHLVGDVVDSRILVKSISGFGKEDIPQDIDLEVFMDSLGKTIEFSSLEEFRLVYSYYKSGNYLNYETSEMSRFVKGFRNGYQSRFSSDSLIPRINELFNNFNNKQDQISRVSFMLSFVVELIKATEPPSMKVFRHILDHMNNCDLLAYQLIIMRHLTPIKFKSSALADSQSPKLTALQYKELIEEEPELVNTLFNYYDKIDSDETIEQLLSYLKLEEVLELEILCSGSIYNQLISKSSFLKSRSSDLNQLEIVSYDTPQQMILSRDTMKNIIGICIKHKKYKYIDFLINKILLQSNEDGVLLMLNDDPQLIFNLDQMEKVLLNVFDKELMLLIIKVINESNDRGRLMWLLPNLDLFLKHYLSAHREGKKLQKVYETFRNGVFDSDFLQAEKVLGVNLKLVFNIYNCLRIHTSDTTVAYYEKLIGIPAPTDSVSMDPLFRNYFEL